MSHGGQVVLGPPRDLHNICRASQTSEVRFLLDLRAICTLFVEPQHSRRALFEGTCVRPAQYWWGFIKLGGPFFVGRPCDLHTICGASAQSEVPV